MAAPSFSVCAVPTLGPEGSRARSLYPDFPRATTLFRPARAFPELFALVGGTVPDLRGLFLRGHGGNSAGLGVHQGHATRNYNGVGYIWTGFGADLRASGAFVWNSSWGISAPAASWGGWTCNQYRIDVSPAAYGVPVANEVRPDNQAVRYLIRAMP